MDINKQVILITGGVGYIGSHTVLQILESGVSVVILDNLVNSKEDVIKRIEKITSKVPDLIVGDVRDRKILRTLFEKYKVSSVIHFAGLKAVGDSVSNPLEYYDNNVSGSLILLEEMKAAGIKTFIFSSSATVYGDPEKVPLVENSPLKPTNPYGQTKLTVEKILIDLYRSDNSWRIATLRYFNPVGAHESGLIGESPNGTPNNLMPYIAQVAIGKLPKLKVFGNDYQTPDGTGVRDYIHVCDLARGHLCALKTLNDRGGFLTVNLGTGKGFSVLEMIRSFEKASGKNIPFEIVERRAGDISQCYADATLAKKEIGWEAKFDLNKMCEDSWRWQKLNPNG